MTRVTKVTLSALALVGAVLVYLVTRTPPEEPATPETVEPPVVIERPAATPATGAPALELRSVEAAEPERLVVKEVPAAGAEAPRTHVLRVVLEGLSEEEARRATIAVTVVDARAFDVRLATREQQREYVRWVQTSLNELLGAGLEVDGGLGHRTREALRALQEREGLRPNGLLEAETEAALLRHVGTDAYGPRWPADVRQTWPCQGIASEFDLDPFLERAAAAGEGLRLDALEVSVDHPVHRLGWDRVALTRDEDPEHGRVVYEARMRLEPAAVIHGVLEREDGEPAADGLVGALLLEEDFPVDETGRAVECAADGRFVLRLPASGRHVLVAHEEGRRPTTTRVDAVVGARLDVGTLVVDPGHAITGHVLGRGQPVAGASVGATPPTHKTAAPPGAVESGLHASVYEGRTFVSLTRRVHLLWLTPETTFATSRREGRFERSVRRQWIETDADGAFAFRGLGSGEYLVSLEGFAGLPRAPSSWKRPEGLRSIHCGTPGLAIRAPAHGVVLEASWTTIRFEFSGDLEPGDEGRLLLRTPTLRPTPVDENGVDLRLVADPDATGLNFTPKFWSAHYALSGAERTLVLEARPQNHMTGEVAFPGRAPVPLDFWTSAPGGEVVVPVELQRLEDAATLVVTLQNPPAGIDTFTVRTWRAGQEKDPPEKREVPVEDGRLRLEDLLPGAYRVRLRPGVDRYYASGLFFDGELDVELPAGVETTRSVRLREGGGLRLTVRGEDGELVAGQFELFDEAGLRVPLVLGTDVTDVSDASISMSSFDAYPVHTSLGPLEPGRYRLVLRATGLAEREVDLELRAGAYEEVEVTLVP